MKSVKTTSGTNRKAEDAAMKIKQEPKNVNELSQDFGHLTAVQGAKYKVIENETVCVRFLNGSEARFDHPITMEEILVAVANRLGMFAPQVKIYGFFTGKLI